MVKSTHQMLFFIIFLLLLISIHTYVYWHLWQLLALPAIWKTALLSLTTLLFVGLFVYISPLMDSLPMWLSKTVYIGSTSWLIIFLYLFLIFLLLDIGRICHVVPKAIMHNNWITVSCITGVVVLLCLLGNIHFHHKEREFLTIKTDKSLSQSYRILFMSDLHLGYNISKSELSEWINTVNTENADLILIGGDIIDGNIRPLMADSVWEEFRRLKAPVYACLGNHEYIAGRSSSEDFYAMAGIHLLKDKTTSIGDLTIIGRDDRSNPSRKDLASLVQDIDSTHFTILLDHQPYHLEEASTANIDLQLSGHTHRGQVWPLSWIIDLLYECSHGSIKKGKTNYYVSSGIGIWGGKFRIGTNSEYLVVELEN